MCVVPGPASQVAVIKRVYASPGLQCIWPRSSNDSGVLKAISKIKRSVITRKAKTPVEARAFLIKFIFLVCKNSWWKFTESTTIKTKKRKNLNLC